jgi:GNAT superfamily N-acetyltransferase
MPSLVRDLLLRPFRLSDVDAIEPWLRGAGLSVPPGAAGRDWPARVLADQRIVMQVAEAHGRQLGLVRLDCGPDRVAEVTVVVAPDSRRCGLGRAMMQAAVANARGLGLKRLVASIELGNDAALEFFADMGFVHTGLSGNRVQLQRPVHAGIGEPPLEIDV